MLRKITNIEGIVFKDTSYEVPLVPVTVVDSELLRSSALTGILMCANVDVEALQITLDTNYATFWSRSREGIWVKGETSGNLMLVRNVYTDCDFDVLLYDVVAPIASCHNGTVSCFEK